METSDIFNINSQDTNSRTSLAKILFVFYVLIASGYTDGLMGKQMREYIQDNKFMQHFIGFSTMIVLVSLVGGVVDIRSVIVYVLIGYIWFVFSTKVVIHWNFIIMI